MYELTTRGNYHLDEVCSTLQKALRRGLEEEAMYWALEMAESGYGAYLWRRLQVVAAEDIGLADPLALVITVAGWQATAECTKSFTKAPGMKTEFLGMVILYLCRSLKNRESDDFACYIMARRKRGWRLEIPDYALDEHTDRGRRMGRGDEYWWTEGSRIVNHRPAPGVGDIYRDKLLAISPSAALKVPFSTEEEAKR